jgi:hypothetical protein
MAESPRAEVSPKSIDELFSADPMDLGPEDYRRIIAEFRAKRDIWEKAEVQKQIEGRKPKAKAKAEPGVQLAAADLDDIMNSIIKES